MADIAEGMIEIEILENPKGEEWAEEERYQKSYNTQRGD